MSALRGRRAVVTGGSRGLGRGIVEALVARGAEVHVVAREAGPLAEVAHALGVTTTSGDVSDPGLAERVITTFRPDLLVLNAGAKVPMGSLLEQSWESFSATWDHDVKAGLLWMQSALRHMSRGRVLVMSSGAAIGGSPLSGGYAGAKRMLWIMADYANACAVDRDRDLKFQTLIPMQVIGETSFGAHVADAYAKKKGITREAFLASFGAPMPPREVGDHVVALLEDPRYESPRAFTLSGKSGLAPHP